MKIFYTIFAASCIIVHAQVREVPFSTNSAKDCKTDCIDKGFSFCPLSDYGLCCDNEKCGMDDCSHLNTSKGARYLACTHNSFCGDRVHTASNEKQVITLVDG